MARYKGSRYNHFVPLGDGRRLGYNAATRAFHLFPPGDWSCYERLTAGDEVEPGIAARLQELGYVVPDGFDEIAAVGERYRQSRESTASLTLTIAPTMYCNFGCDYCFQGQEKPTSRMSADVQQAIAAYVDSEGRAGRLKHLSIAWYGGEPLLGLDVIGELSIALRETCARHGATYGAMAVTNGFMLRRPVIDKLHQLGVHWVQVTLDGPEDIHDQRRYLIAGKSATFERIVRNLRESVEQTGVTFVIRVNVDSRNHDRIRDLVDQLADAGLARRKNFALYLAPVESHTEGCRQVSGHVMTRQTYAAREVDVIKYAAEKGFGGAIQPPSFFSLCAAVKPRSYVILPSGDLHKCWDTVNTPERRVGTIFDIASSARDGNHRKWLDWTPLDDSICRECTTLPLCAGSCAYKHIYREDENGPDSRPCPSWKYNLQAKLVLLAKARGMLPKDFPEPEGLPKEPEPAVAGQAAGLVPVDLARLLGPTFRASQSAPRGKLPVLGSAA